MFSTFEKIKELCKKQGISLNQLEDKLGFSQNYIYSIKKGNPKVENLQKIADYFNVSTDYLLCRTDNPKLYTTPDGKEVDFLGFVETDVYRDDLAYKISEENSHLAQDDL